MKLNIFAAIIAVFAVATCINARTVKNISVIAPIVENQKTYMYNSNETNNRVIYSNDEQGRITNKVVLRKENEEWIPVGAYSVYYGDTENVITYAGWNADSRTFTKNPSQQHFDAKEFPVVMTMPE